MRARPTPRDRTRDLPALATRRLRRRDAAAAGERLRQRLEAVLPPRPPPALPAADTPADTLGEPAAAELPAFGEYVAVQVRNRLWRCAPPHG